MLMEIAYTSSESKMLCPPSLKFAEFRYRDFFAMLFLLTTFALESKCKITKKNWIGKKNILPFPGNDVLLQRFF